MAHDTPSGSDEFIDADKRDILAAAKFIPTEPFTIFSARSLGPLGPRGGRG